jgi:hypothetical protein
MRCACTSRFPKARRRFFSVSLTRQRNGAREMEQSCSIVLWRTFHRDVALQMEWIMSELEVRQHHVCRQQRQALWTRSRVRDGKRRANGAGSVVYIASSASSRHRLVDRGRCPVCFNSSGFDVIHSGGLIPMEGPRSFRPALKRFHQNMGERFWLPLMESLCFWTYGQRPIISPGRRRWASSHSSPLHAPE